ncbi:hypothetical protein ACKO6P_002132, partial [Enterococcus faecium]
MLDTDFLFEKYKEKIHCVKKRKKPLTTLKEMVDVNEVPISKIYKDHLEMLKTNVVNSIYVRKEKTIEFHLFYVDGMATVFLTNFIRCRTSFRMLLRLSLTMSLLGCDDLRQELTVKVRLP